MLSKSQKAYISLVKRPIGFIGALIALIILSPIFLATMILLFFANKNGFKGIFFTQDRPGKNEKIFKALKFKTMTDERDAEGNLLPDADRLTKIGKFIRSTSIDELPQLINVLKGDMSLIGPRPERRYFVEQFKEEIPRYMIKHQVRPGMTGWAQVNGYRGDTDIRKRIEFDLYYIENWSFLFDLKIMVLTVFKGFINKNAY